VIGVWNGSDVQTRDAVEVVWVAGEKRQIMRDCRSGDQRVEARAAGLRPDFRRAAATVPNTRAASLSNAIASKSASARCRCLPSPTGGA
jgi:hypothetical protein